MAEETPAQSKEPPELEVSGEIPRGLDEPEASDGSASNGGFRYSSTVMFRYVGEAVLRCLLRGMFR